MLSRPRRTTATAASSAALAAFMISGVANADPTSSPAGSGSFQFTPLASSAPCTDGGNPAAPFVLPPGYQQRILASEPEFPDLPDMNTQNEDGPDAGRFLYRPHEVGANGSVTVTDLETGVTRTLAQRADWERLDGIVWTPQHTILTAEETNAPALRDPQVPQANKGLVYEIDPVTGAAVARPAIGSKSHEGMRFDPQGNLYSISEANPGYIYRFTPDVRGDLSEGQLYVLRVTTPTGDRTGEAEWVPLPRAAVQVDADAAASAVGATGYSRPEDVEITTSTGNSHQGANTLFVSITGRPSDNRVLAVDLREPAGGATHDTAFVYDYVRVGVNAPADFEMPDNLALDRSGNLFIAEDPGSAPTTRRGDDIWVAEPPRAAGTHAPAKPIQRFASLTDCQAEPTGIYFNHTGTPKLFVNVQHRGGDGLDKAMEITPPQPTTGNNR